MGYSYDEQETTLVYDGVTKEWYVYSSVPKHIRKLKELTELNVLEYDADGTTPISVKATLADKQVSMKKLRTYTDEQRQELSERGRKLAEKRNQAT